MLILPIAYILFKLGYNPYAGVIGMMIVNLVSLQARIIYISRLGIPYSIFFAKVFIPTLPCILIGGIYLIAIHKIIGMGILSYIGYTALGSFLLLNTIYFLGLDTQEKAFIRHIIKSKIKFT